jgi:hypothetical protein
MKENELNKLKYNMKGAVGRSCSGLKVRRFASTTSGSKDYFFFFPLFLFFILLCLPLTASL